MERAHEVLRETFGFPSFRLAQEDVIHRLLVQDENALVLFPTGGLRAEFMESYFRISLSYSKQGAKV